MSFEVDSRPGYFRAIFPTAAISMNAAQIALANLPSACEHRLEAIGQNAAMVELKGNTANHLASNLFAAINGYPQYQEGLLKEFRNSTRPLISCILLLPFNELFARNVILPSIIRNSVGYAIEIIVVCAGFGINRKPFQHLHQLDSELTSIAKGYNLGVHHARGEYVALFHDDCFLDDPFWIPKALDTLTDGVAAVTPEFDQWQKVPVAKAVPIVTRRADYLHFGGYDEYYFAGVEDMDFTVRLMAAGQEVRRVNIGYRHLRGMGSSLIVHERPHQLKLLFGYQVLPESVIRHVHRDMMQRLLSNGWIRMLEGDYHLRFLEKHGDFLVSHFSIDVKHAKHAYQVMRYPYLLTPHMAYITNRNKLVEAYRGLMNAADLIRPIDEREDSL